MPEQVLTALVAGILAVLGSYLGNVAVTSKRRQEDQIRAAQREQRQNDRMDVIEKKLDEHNGYARRLGEIEKSLAAIQKDVDYLRRR